MKKLFYAYAVTFALCSYSTIYSMAVMAEWTVIDYMQADNNLSSFSYDDMNEMIKGLREAATVTDHRVNILVQLDLPNNEKTWRFKISSTGRIEDESVNDEMGINPEKELVATARWIKSRYPANHYFWILWNHGSGVEDYRTIKSLDGKIKFKHSFLEIPGSPINQLLDTDPKDDLDDFSLDDITCDCQLTTTTASENIRGILYDDSQRTCLTNQALTSAFLQIRDILTPGRKLDIMGMDACLMAMLEVVYQVKDCFHFFVGSQQLEPGSGWEYTAVVRPLAQSAETITADNLAKIAVDSYGICYASSADQSYTQSALDLEKIGLIKNHIDTFVAMVDQCVAFKASIVKNAVYTARINTMCFDNKNYIDLYSFFREMHKEIAKLIQIAEDYTPTCWFNRYPPEYVAALRALLTNLEEGMNLISNQVVIRNTYGHNFIVGSEVRANGISIYYPNPNKSTQAIHSSYYQTIFGQTSRWLSFITRYRK